ncbi:MAG: pilus assembly protein, partial [Nitratireductor sp.]|nr:pilus assembly protein [Nitratireductor sp.]
MLIRFRNFLHDTGAAYGPLFAILTVPLFGTAAAAVEYSRLIDTKSNIQNALDAAALATGKELSSSADQSYLEQYARNFFDANLD